MVWLGNFYKGCNDIEHKVSVKHYFPSGCSALPMSVCIVLVSPCIAINACKLIGGRERTALVTVKYFKCVFF